ncbi:MAG: DUF2551 domain-containing protein [Halobacteriota archaeon]|nr:DUF2551 domain-containing protein [Halobacteriota archaeon]
MFNDTSAEGVGFLDQSDQIGERVKNYLNRDHTGVRKAILMLFLSDEKTFTTEDVFTSLEGNFDISYRGISAMVGLMNTRLGILSVDVTGEHNVYCLKDSHKDLLESILGNY